MSKTTFIYALTCPDTGEIRYIGKANSPRLRFYQHIYGRKRLANHKNRWVKSLLDSGKRPGMVVLEEVPFVEWQKAEKRWIEHYRLVGTELTNMADGGQGRRTDGTRTDNNSHRFSITFPDDLAEWIVQQAKDNHKSVNEYIGDMLNTAMETVSGHGEQAEADTISVTITISDELNNWLIEQARLNHRSKNKHIEYILEMARKPPYLVTMKPDSSNRYEIKAEG